MPLPPVPCPDGAEQDGSQSDAQADPGRRPSVTGRHRHHRFPARRHSFDDAQGTQATEALPQLVQRQMTGTFFAMTVVLGKQDWLSRDDLKRLDAAGMTVGAHTWDHQRVDRYGDPDRLVQLDQPRELLEGVIGAPVEHFAYPFGAWNATAFPHLTSVGYRTAFQLTDQPTDPTAPVLSLRRTLLDSTGTTAELLARVRSA